MEKQNKDDTGIWWTFRFVSSGLIVAFLIDHFSR